MQQIGGPGWRTRLGCSKEDEDLIACQIIALFFWVLLFFIINFFILHRSNTVPSAEAYGTDMQPLEEPEEMAETLVKLVLLPDHKDYKPNYYFLYKDQVRFKEPPPRKKVLVASLKTPDLPAVTPEKEKEKIKEELDNLMPPREPDRLEWLDMSLIEDDKAKIGPADPGKAAAETTTHSNVKVVMAGNLDMDLKIVQDAPAPLISSAGQKSKQVSPSVLTKMRVLASGMDIEGMDMKIVEEESLPEESVRKVVLLPVKMNPAMVSAKAAGHVSMLLEITEKTGKDSRISAQETIKERSQTANIIPMAAKGLSGIELPVDIIERDSETKENEKKERNAAPRSSKSRSLDHKPPSGTVGSISLGKPLPFKLAAVETETHSGNAYVRRSTQLKRFLDQQRLPASPVTKVLKGKRGQRQGVVAISYSRTQVVLQYASGKQHVITFDYNEPYPRFELRQSGKGIKSVSVGTKLEEISTCLSLLQHVLVK